MSETKAGTGWTLTGLRARNLARATTASARVTVEPKDDAPPEAIAAAAKMNARIDEYLGHFAAPDADGRCLACGALLVARDDIRAALFDATFTWGLAHGEGYCRACGYPARGLHHIKLDDKGSEVTLPRVFQYHPDELREREPAATSGVTP
jgi:hypothetical protein